MCLAQQATASAFYNSCLHTMVLLNNIFIMFLTAA